MRKLFILALFLLIGSLAYSQDTDINALVDEGVALHDSGNYVEAINKYKQALKLDKNSSLVNYEIAYSYSELKAYKEAMRHCKVVLSQKSDETVMAAILYGSILDDLGKTKKSIRFYEKIIKEYPSNYLLSYNLALSYYNNKQLESAEQWVENAIMLNPTHAGSHLLLASIMNASEQRVKCVLALYYFLMIEPTSLRAGQAYDLLLCELKQDVDSSNPDSVKINVVSNSSDEFDQANLLLGMLEASKQLTENRNKNFYQLFAENNETFFRGLGKMSQGKRGFWWDFYVDFFKDLSDNGNSEAFSYFISRAHKNQQVDKWVSNNSQKLNMFANWLENYQPSNN